MVECMILRAATGKLFVNMVGFFFFFLGGDLGVRCVWTSLWLDHHSSQPQCPMVTAAASGPGPGRRKAGRRAHCQ